MTAPRRTFEFPPEQQAQRRKARRLSWLSVLLLATTAVLMKLTLGQSEAMKTAWVEDLLGMVPPMMVLLTMRLEDRPPTRRFPYGYYRAVSVGFLVAAASLSIIGLWLLLDSVSMLVARERPPIGTMHLFGHTFWLGWAMVAALSYSVVVGYTLGSLKRPVARAVNDRVLEADADMNRADWMAEGAAIVGILLVGFGHWWGDAAAAGLISLSIIRDGWLNLKQVIADLMDESPSKVGGDEMESLPRRIERAAELLPWVERAAVRLREQGHLITGSVFVVPKSPPELLTQAEGAATELMKMDWRLHGLTVVPTTSLEEWGPPRQSSD